MMDRKISAIVIVSVMFIGAAGAGYFIYHPDLSRIALSLNRSRASTDPVLSFQPSTNTPEPGEEFTVNVNIDTGNRQVSGTEVHLTWPSNLQLLSMTAGSFLPVELSPEVISGNNAVITLGSDPSDPKRGQGVLATLRMKALTAGISNVQFDNDTKVAVIGEEVNTIEALQPVSIVIATPTPASTPTPEPTETPEPSVTPPLTWTGGYIGNIDGVTPNGSAITGYAIESYNAPVEIYIKFYKKSFLGTYTYDGYVRQTTNLVRRDINNQYNVAGPHGFSYPLYFLPDKIRTANKDYKLNFFIRPSGASDIGFPFGGNQYLTANQIRNVPEPDEHRWDVVISEITGIYQNDSLEAALDRAIEAGLITSRDEIGPNFTVTVFNPDIPGHVLLSVRRGVILPDDDQSSIGPRLMNKILSSFNVSKAKADVVMNPQNEAAKGYGVCYLTNGTPVLMFKGQANIGPVADSTISVSCSRDEPACRKVVENVKAAINQLNRFTSTSNAGIPQFTFYENLRLSAFNQPGDLQIQFKVKPPGTYGGGYEETMYGSSGAMVLNRIVLFKDDFTERSVANRTEYIIPSIIHEILHAMGLADDARGIMRHIYKTQNPVGGNVLDRRILESLEQIYKTDKIETNNCTTYKKHYTQKLSFPESDFGGSSAPENVPSVSNWNVYDWLLNFYMTLPYFSPPPDEMVCHPHYDNEDGTFRSGQHCVSR